uniref:DM8 domain-containing protein n=1 Tax=Oryza barthii TaxID=65489 RepID=A0A0D3H1Z5_9ORYZ
MATGGEPRAAAAAAEGGEKRAALLREITEEGGFAFVASAEKAAADGDLRAAEAARESGVGAGWHACPRSEPRAAAAAAEGGEKRAALLREITEEGGFAFVASAEKAAADGDLRAAEAAREMAWEQLHACPRSEVGRAWRDAYALACLHVAALRVAGGGGDGRRAALRALDMGLIMGGDLLRAELEEAIARVVADRSRGCGGGGGDGAGENGADVEKWMEGLTRKRDLADVLKVLPVKSLSCKQIERRSCIFLEAFIRDYFLCESPVILSGYIDHWPARTKWKDIRYLERIAGDRTVPVELLVANVNSSSSGLVMLLF